jgi:hypothetical protein
MEDVQFLNAPHMWPGNGERRVCCVKKYPKDLRPGAFPPLDCFGMVLAEQGQVFGMNGAGSVTIFREDFDAITYPSMQALMDDGWVVD